VANYHPSMRDLYERLAKAGIDRAFLRKAVLPPWWEDDLAAIPANRQLAEIYLAQILSLDLEALQSPNRVLDLPAGRVRFKRSQRADPKKIQPTAFVARQAGEMLAESIVRLPPYAPATSPLEVRQWIFRNGYGQVDLRSLVDYCWAHGIIVFHLGIAIPDAHRLDGMVMFCGDRPVIMLGSGRRIQSWLAFHLAHELGHLLRGHVKPGSEPLADFSLETGIGGDNVEQEANRQAFAILTQDFEPDVDLPAGTLSKKLLFRAEELGNEWRVDPGILILIHAQKHGAWKEAARSLQYHFGEDGETAKAVIDRALLAHIDYQDLPKTVARFLDATVLPST
jgi:Zn-dependent peptidase ImmA (M78 family)